MPELLAFNKADVSREAKRLSERYPGSVELSALTGEGVDGMLQALGDRLRALDDDPNDALARLLLAQLSS